MLNIISIQENENRSELTLARLIMLSVDKNMVQLELSDSMMGL